MELHAKSDAQFEELSSYFLPDVSNAEKKTAKKHFLADKLVALDRIKAEFCCQLCRSIKALQQR